MVQITKHFFVVFCNIDLIKLVDMSTVSVLLCSKTGCHNITTQVHMVNLTGNVCDDHELHDILF
jgi:hypothetical protein